jgi:FkbM family methyltransferase
MAAVLPGATIHAFEPNPNIVPDLRRNIAAFPQVKAFPFALGDRETRTHLNICGSSLNSSVLQYSRKDGTDHVVETLEVPMDTVDHFCAGQGIHEIDLLKTDVQGYDLNVFKGATGLLEAGRIHAAFCEVNFHTLYDGQCSFEDTYAFLRSHGFSLCGFYDLVREGAWHIHWADALFIRPEYFGKRPDRK